MREVPHEIDGLLIRARRGGEEVFAEVSPHPGCKAYNEDANSWILTLFLDSLRIDEFEEDRNRLVGSDEHSWHLRGGEAPRD